MSCMQNVKPCIECGKSPDAPTEQQSADYPICSKCLSENWVTDLKAIAEAISNDTELSSRIDRVSPIQREDL